MKIQLYNATQVAATLKVSVQYVRRLSVRYGIGTFAGPKRVYLPTDIKRMRKYVRPRGWPLGRKRKRR